MRAFLSILHFFLHSLRSTKKFFDNNGIFFFLVVILLNFLNCKKTLDVSFYSWKTKFAPTELEEKTLLDLKVQKIYLRFFDVDTREGKPYPIGELNNYSPRQNTEIVPVVYITNFTFFDLAEKDQKDLANKIFTKIETLSKKYGIEYSEIQIDSDWTENTKERFFQFLTGIKEISKKKISCTLRLHQIKYYSQTGIPPADQYVLMFYNIGNLSNPDTNSILNVEDASKYVESLKDYPKHFDIALPIFGWIVHKRGGRIVQIYSKLDINTLLSANILKMDKEDSYLVTKSSLTKGIFLREDDVLKLEFPSPQELTQVSGLIKKNIKSENRRVIFFDLDENNLKVYNHEILKNILDNLR